MGRILADVESTREAAAQLVAAGGVVAFRTDTFYGLGVDPFNRTALRRLKALKGREGSKPILVIISERERTGKFIKSQSQLFKLFAERHWPGPLTLVGPARTEVPEELTAGSGTIGVRLPLDEEVRAFVREVGGALTATSANPAGQPPASTAQEVAAYFPSELELIIDAGPAQNQLPSTVLDVSGPDPRLIRAGALSKEDLESTLRELKLHWG
ncbi:MAG TPA: L-threonylcarbamoyladenylate synthase [Pyrinomonadaceae bacterium]|jgi:L-threonylcarbamoyladenylate synthase